MSYKSYVWGNRIKWIVAALIAFIIFLSSVSTYNGLVEADQNVQRQWSQVENVMQRKADLIPNLVETVKGYVKEEKEIFGDIAAARSNLLQSNTVDEKFAANTQLSEATNKMLLLVENYPDLKASEQFRTLQEELSGSENRISTERLRFIDKVQAYNTKVKRFPGSIFANVMGFDPKEYYEASPEAKEPLKIEFE